MQFIKRLHWMLVAPRIGPDLPLTHFLLHSRSGGEWLCRRKFKKFGKGACIRPFVYADYTNQISIGANVVVRPGSFLMASDQIEGEIIIEDDVLLGPSVSIFCADHDFSDPRRPISEQGYRAAAAVIIKRGAWIGASVVVLPGVTIGENAVIGAGSVVVSSVPARSVGVGNPLRIVRTT
jgi:acetyltransferase-like isoleucine patch superfamily enzyme